MIRLSYLKLNLFLATSDFEKFNETRLPVRVFSRVGTVQTVNIRVIDDNVFEADEMFMAVLELVNDSRIILQPNTTEISIIMDDDSKYSNLSIHKIIIFNAMILILMYPYNLSVAVMVGFTYENYTVTEGVDIFADLTVDLKMEAVIEQSVVVRVSTQADSAKGTYVCMFIKAIKFNVAYCS